VGAYSRIEELPVNTRAYNMLKRIGVSHVGDLLSLSREELMRVPNIGPGTIDHIAQVIDEQGLWFANWLSQPVVERENIGRGSWSRNDV